MILILLLLSIATIGVLAVTCLAAFEVLAANHVLWSLFSVPFGLFTLTMHLFYFIGTGSEIKAHLATEHVAPETRLEILNELRCIKKRAFPLVAAALLLLMFTFVTGGMAGIGLAPRWLHSVLGAMSVPLSLVALTNAHLTMRRNFFLILRVTGVKGW